MKLLILLTALLLSFSQTSFAATSGQIDSEKSVLKWFGEKKIGAKHFGIIKLSPDQKIVLKDGLPSSGEIKIDINTIFVQDLEKDSSDHKRLMAHLRSKDFFKVKDFPFARIKILSSKKISDKKVEVATELTIKDKTEALKLMFDMSKSGEHLVAKSKFSINRKKWSLTYGSNWFNSKLDKVIKDTISFEIEIFVSK